MIKKYVSLLGMAFLFSSHLFCQNETIVMDKLSSVILKLPYEKPEGIEEIYDNPRFSVIIESVYLNGEDADIGKLWYSAGGDEAFDAKRTVVSSEAISENANLLWTMMDRNETGNRYLFFNSIATRSPVYYCIPEYTDEVSITYKVQFPFTDYVTESYTKTFSLEWNLPDKDYINEIEVIVFGFNSGLYDLNDKINLATIKVECEDYKEVKEKLTDIYNSFSEEKKELFSESYKMMMEYVECLTYMEKNKYMKFKTWNDSPCFALLIK